MEDKALRGIPWTVLSYAVGKAVTVSATIVLARLLLPEDFGVVALALLAVESISYLFGLGLGPALIVRQDLGRTGMATGLTLMVLIGVGSAGVLAAASPLVASAFDEPRLTAVLVWLAAGMPLGAVASFYATVIQRELEFRRRFVTQAAQVVGYAGVAIILASAGAGVWSLVGGQIASSVAYVAAVLALTPYRVRPAFDRAAARALCSTGTGFMLQATAAFVQHNVDYFAVGRWLGTRQLGFYTMAFRLSELPYYAIADPVAQVAFPSVTRMHGRGEDVARSFLRTLQVVAVVSVPFGIVLTAAAEPFTAAVLGERWLPMAGALSVLGIWAAIRPAQTMLSWFLNSVGSARRVGTLSVVMALLLLPAVAAAAAWGGITAVSWVVLAALLAFAAALAVVVRERLAVGLQQQWRAVRAAALGGAASWVGGRLAVEVTGSAPAGVRLVAGAAAVFVVYVAAVTVVEPPLVRAAVKDVGRMFGRVPAAPPALDAAAASPLASPSLDDVP